jgi:magnesium chelatase accessory protein
VKPPPDPDRQGSSEPFTEANRSREAGGVHWHLRRLGSGPPLLLLHGSASSCHAWEEVAVRLRSFFSLVIPDLPGHGNSSQLPAGLGGPDDLARALAALLRAEGVEPALVAGHSVGAVLAIRAAHLGWIRPRGILGVNPALGPRSAYLPPIFEPMAAWMARSQGAARLSATLVRHLPVVPGLLKSTGSSVSRKTEAQYAQLLRDPMRVQGVLRLQASWDAAGVGLEAEGLEARVRFLTGSRDTWVPPERIRVEAPEVDTIELADRGHLLPEEDPEAVAGAILRLGEETGVLRPSHEAPFGPPEPERA